jgi:DtxR family Mn-dependent transcriptional regulator
LQLQDSVTIKKLAKLLKIKPPSVVDKLKILEKKGFIIYQKKLISLTEKGREVAEKIIKKYEVAHEFLKQLSVPEKIAGQDAHIIEHALHEETLLQLERLIDYLKITNYKNYELN